MFSFKINGRRLSDDNWDPFKFSHEDLQTRLRRRAEFFYDSWFKELPISRILEDRFPKGDKKSDDESCSDQTGAEDIETEPLTPGQTIELGSHRRNKIFDDPFFKDFMSDDFENFSFDKTFESGNEKSATETKDMKAVTNFQVTFETGDFEPDEIEVILDGDNLQVHGKKSKPGESREMFKNYTLPENINKDELSSSLSKDGLLQVTAPFKEIPKVASKHDVQVEVPTVDFNPENIQVTVDGRRLKVHAKKADERAGQATQEEVTRWFTLPETASAEGLTSSIGPDGAIVIQVPMGFSGSLEISGGDEAESRDSAFNADEK